MAILLCFGSFYVQLPLSLFVVINLYWSGMNIGVVSLAVAIKPRDPAKLDCCGFGSVNRRSVLEHLLVVLILSGGVLLIIFGKAHDLKWA